MPFLSASAISPYDSIRGGAEGGITGTLLLDLYPGASAAYSLRQLRTAYEGPAIKARRQVDGALLDIGFVDGNLDTASLLAFAAGTNGYASVATWYDQSENSPNTRNLTQAAASKMPLIVVNNVLVVDASGNPAFSSENVNGFNFQTPSVNLLGVTDAYSIFTTNVMSSDTGTQYFSLYGTSAPYPFRWVKTGTNSRAQNYATNGSFSLPLIGIETNTHYVQSFIRTPSTAQVFANSVGGAELTGLNPPVTDQSNILYYSFSSLSLKAKTQEFIIYPSNQSANRRAIETNTNNYYSIYPTVLDFNPYNVWDSEHISINNTTTTFTDFNTVGTPYDLVNPAASNQPLYTSSDDGFRGLPSLTFDGVAEYVKNSATDYRSSDSSGLVAGVLLIESGSNFDFLGSTGLSSSEIMGSARIISNKYRPRIANGSFDNRISASTTTVSTLTPYVFTFGSTGSEYKITINGVQQSISVSLGNNDGKWYDDVTVKNIAVGLLPSRNLYSNITWCMSGYFPYVDDETTESLVTALKNKYIDAPVPDDPILAFSPFNVWDSEHVVVDGTETTFIDFNDSGEGSYNLTNPAATNQPVYNQRDTNFNDLPSFGFDGVDNYLIGDASDYRNSDDSGVFISVYILDGGSRFNAFVVSSSSTNNYIGYSVVNSNTFRFVTVSGPARSWRGSTNVNNNTTSYAVANANTGSEYKQWINETSQTITMVTPTLSGNDGSIWTDAEAFNNIAVGALVRQGSATNFADMRWAFSGYFPYESDSQVEEILTYLVTKYNL